MILCDRSIEKAIRDRRILFTSEIDSSQFDSTSLNLRVGNDFRVYKQVLRATGTAHAIDLDTIDLADIVELTEPLRPNEAGLVVIPPEAFVLVRTLEHVHLPTESKIAARVEGRSKLARLGMTVHMTAPTIHAGFEGNITLEIKNFGPFELRVRPNQSRLCQLIFETVDRKPLRGGSIAFSHQTTPLGTPKRPR